MGYRGIAAVTLGDERVFERNINATPQGDDQPLSSESQVLIGSVVKPITGATLSALVAQGRLPATLRVRDVFPDAPPDKATITLHQLLTHSAGLPIAVASDRELVSRAAFLELAMEAPLGFEPGSAYAYSNTGFSLAVAMAEAHTGKSYLDLVRQYLFQPARMTQTGYDERFDRDRMATTADGRLATDASWGRTSPGWALLGNGGMVSTLTDLTHLAQFIGHGAAKDVPWARLMTTPHQDEGGGSAYGYGLVVEDIPAIGLAYWHNGGNPFFQTDVRYLAEHDLTLVTHATSSPVSVDTAAHALMRAAFDLPLRLPPPADTPPLASLPETPEGQLVEAFLTAITSAREADWRRFITEHLDPQLLAQVSMEEHLAFFAMAHADLGGMEVLRFERDDARTVVTARRPGQPAVTLIFAIAYDAGQAKFAGLQLE
ncbi:MAG: serine hydrolase domain-containing protein [Pseudomonadota bacterium]